MTAQCKAIPAPQARSENRWVKNTLNNIRAYLQQHRARKIDRDAFDQLKRLDDSMLRDIGVTRADVIWASNLPLAKSASDELELIARGYKIKH